MSSGSRCTRRPRCRPRSLGYVIGGTLAGGTSPKSALLVNALTFAVSAALLTIGTKHREPALPRSGRTHLLRETADGFRLVFTTPALRALVLLVFATVAVRRGARGSRRGLGGRALRR